MKYRIVLNWLIIEALANYGGVISNPAGLCLCAPVAEHLQRPQCVHF